MRDFKQIFENLFHLVSSTVVTGKAIPLLIFRQENLRTSKLLSVPENSNYVGFMLVVVSKLKVDSTGNGNFLIGKHVEYKISLITIAIGKSAPHHDKPIAVLK